jgi:hypothetical protein
MDSGIPFIDLLINFTMSPYSTYFYTGSIHVQYVALQEYFSHPRLVIYFFPNVTHKTETWIAKGERPNSTSNPCRPIKVSSQSTAGVRCFSAFCQPLHLVQNVWWKPFCWAKLASIDFVYDRHFCRVTYWAPLEISTHTPFSGLYGINVYHKQQHTM